MRWERWARSWGRPTTPSGVHVHAGWSHDQYSLPPLPWLTPRLEMPESRRAWRPSLHPPVPFPPPPSSQLPRRAEQQWLRYADHSPPTSPRNVSPLPRTLVLIRSLNLRRTRVRGWNPKERERERQKLPLLVHHPLSLPDLADEHRVRNIIRQLCQIPKVSSVLFSGLSFSSLSCYAFLLSLYSFFRFIFICYVPARESVCNIRG